MVIVKASSGLPQTLSLFYPKNISWESKFLEPWLNSYKNNNSSNTKRKGFTWKIIEAVHSFQFQVGIK